MDIQKIRVMLVDDHPMIRQGLTNLLEMESDLEVCCEAEGAASAISAFSNFHPDLLIIDLSLKEGSGLELIKAIRSMDPGVKMLVLSHFDEELYAERVLAAGAGGYVNKQEASSEIVGAIRKVMGGNTYISARMEERMLERGHAASSERGLQTLSDREMEVFELIGQGIGTKEIADRLYISTKTVETHRDHIRIKLGLKSGRNVTVFAVHWSVNNS